MSHDAIVVLITVAIVLTLVLLLAFCVVQGMRRAVEVTRLQTRERETRKRKLQAGQEHEAEVYYVGEKDPLQYSRVCDYSTSDGVLSFYHMTGWITIIPERLIRKVFIRPARHEEEIEFDVDFSEEEAND